VRVPEASPYSGSLHCGVLFNNRIYGMKKPNSVSLLPSCSPSYLIAAISLISSFIPKDWRKRFTSTRNPHSSTVILCYSLRESNGRLWVPNIWNMRTIVNESERRLVFTYKLTNGVAASSFFGLHGVSLAGVPRYGRQTQIVCCHLPL